MPKQCQADGCNNNVFSNGYCKAHGYLRTDKKKPKPLKKTSLAYSKHNNPLRKKRNTKSVIKNSSSKRQKENALYEQAKINVRKKLQEENNWKCWFTDLVIPDEVVYWHHALGKEGELLYDEDNIYPVSNQAHNDYHHKSLQYLIEKTDWYVDFIKRIYLVKPDVFAIESRRMMKSGLGLKYLAGFFGNLINEIHKY